MAQARSRRKEAWQQTFWNCLRFAVFLFWLLLIYPTLKADQVIYFPMSYATWLRAFVGESAWASLLNVWRPFPWSERWLQVAIAAGLLWRYRQRLNAVAFVTVVAAGLAWMLGMSMFHVQRARHYFAVGAMLALLYGCGLTGLLFAGQEALSRLESPSLPPRLRRFLVPCAVLILLAIILRGVYRRSDAWRITTACLTAATTLRTTWILLCRRASTSPIGVIGNHSVFNRPWGGYTGVHDYPLAQEVD